MTPRFKEQPAPPLGIWLLIVCPFPTVADWDISNVSVADNKLLIVNLGGLEPLIRQMLSPNVEVQCNAVGCVTNLATYGTMLAFLVWLSLSLLWS